MSLADAHSPNKKNRNASIVLGSLEIEILSERVQLPINHSIAVQEVEKVHGPQDRLESNVRRLLLAIAPQGGFAHY